jgi:hypothetical protein
MDQKLDTHGLPRIGRHVHSFVDKRLPGIARMEDGLQNVALAVGDVGILPVVRNAISSAVLMPEAQDAGPIRYCELLIERAVPSRLRPVTAAACRCTVTASECRKSPGVHLGVGNHRRVTGTVNYPAAEVSSLKSFILNYPRITWCCSWCGCRRGCRRRRSGRARCWCGSRRRVCEDGSFNHNRNW